MIILHKYMWGVYEGVLIMYHKFVYEGVHEGSLIFLDSKNVSKILMDIVANKFWTWFYYFSLRN